MHTHGDLPMRVEDKEHRNTPRRHGDVGWQRTRSTNTGEPCVRPGIRMHEASEVRVASTAVNSSRAVQFVTALQILSVKPLPGVTYSAWCGTQRARISTVSQRVPQDQRVNRLRPAKRTSHAELLHRVFGAHVRSDVRVSRDRW